MKRVVLSPEELARGESCGRERMRKATRDGRRDSHSSGSKEQGLADNILGAQGELAFGKWLGKPAPLSTDPDSGVGDVDGKHVRTTRYLNGCLPLRNSEHRDDRLMKAPFVLVAHDGGGVFAIIGWCYGYEIVAEKYWQAEWRVPTYARPGHSLQPMETCP